MTISEFLSLVVSLVAIGFVVKQSKETIKHNKLSIKPILSACVDTTKHNKVTVIIKNNGLGTAIFKKLSVYVKDKEIIGNRNIEQALFIVIGSDIDNYKCDFFSLLDNGDFSLAKDDELLLLELKLDDVYDYNIEDIKPQLRLLSISIEYESLYGEKYTLPRNTENWI